LSIEIWHIIAAPSSPDKGLFAMQQFYENTKAEFARGLSCFCVFLCL